MTARFAWVLLAPIALAGCWTGARFYTAAESVAAVTPGRYRVVDSDRGEQEETRVTILPSGLTLFAGAGNKPEQIGFVPLDPHAGRYVAWPEDALPEGSGPEIPYFILERDGRDYRMLFPMCSDEVAAAPPAGSVFVKDPKVSRCRFGDRQSLEAALRGYRSEAATRLIRVD
ncbi:MAG TPA: hypothetical protein VF727_11535 [Allosphingosinicella sp.]